MRILFLVFPIILSLTGCSEVSDSVTNTDYSNSISTTTPQELAKQCCDCWNDAKLVNNPTGKARKTDICTSLTIQKLSELQELGVSKDWDETEVKSARVAFDEVYSKCE